ncbi:MAG: hypothetical protein M3Y87_34435 [Myxococcota bacterium]|nr:hypothetical protein [Myxococcota bacterium]
MLYDARTRTLIETNVTGAISDARLKELARAQGSKTSQGEPIEKVAVVFAMPGHAEQNVDACKRHGVECRGFTMDGHEQVLFAGTRTGSISARPDGPLLPVLREESWPHVAATAHRRLFGGPIASGPWVTYGWDTPQTIVRMSPNDRGDRSIEDIDREAIANLAARKPKVSYQRIEDHTVVLREEYGAEMILVPEIMREVVAKLGTDMIAVGVPTEHGFFATSATDPQRIGVLIQWARQEFDKTEKRRVSPIPFVVDARGELVGLVTAAPAGPEEPPSKPWWKFW